ncbi:hypothetical protein [Natrinema sp. 1APR25-10V2]|uniref:hypothetical protein n=1 Tax=Natrinema sp. 1APR25-10V2 TaxID=2951081 RepID=UPI002876AAC9|nr:hypothetical protein [Natrinema sp. 1APR25-10V2]MDS0477857.1 hypothetical protein [Natrinema sp. 1APR25-10V2]
MQRRTLLAGTTGALCGLAGCVGSGFDSSRTGVDASSSDDAATERDDYSPRTIVVGDLDAVPFPAAHPPHELVLRNESGTERTVSVEVTTDEDEELLAREFTVSAGRSLEIVLAEPRTYTVSVTADRQGGTSSATVGIDRDPLDCTRSSTTVTLRENGTGTKSVSKSIACPEFRVAERSIETLEQNCADEADDDDATVAFEDEAVIVDGSITTPTPCYEPSIAEATHDERRDALEITVASGEQSAASCADCLGVVDYEARLELEGRYPGHVVVRHESGGGRRRVATAEYPPDGAETERTSG